MFNDYESSGNKGRPYELYEFQFGTLASSYARYTNADSDKVFDGEVFEAIPLERDELKITGRAERQEIVVSLPKATAIAQLFNSYPPPFEVKLKIWEAHFENPDDPASWQDAVHALVFMGKVTESSSEGQLRKLQCALQGNSMKRPGLRRNYQRSCPHILYGSRCGANKAAATTITSVSAISNSRLTLAPGWVREGAEPRSYVGGLVEWEGVFGTEYRTIIKSSLTMLTLSGPVRGLAVGGSVKVSLGCNRTLTVCNTIHHNGPNFGGFPWIPKTNPVGKNNHD